MNKKFFIFIALFLFITMPSSVFADVSGTYNIDRYTLTNYNSEDLTQYYTTNTANLSLITNTNSIFYNFYNMGFSGRYTYNNITTYQPDFINVSNSSGNMSFCTSQCDIDISFNFAIRTSAYTSDTNYSKASAYVQNTAINFTNFSGITLFGKDINNEDKYFYCTGTYVVSTEGQNMPYYRFVGTCPTSNFKYISSIRFTTGFTGGQGLDHTYNGSYNFFITAINYNIRDYTGTQDGVGGSGSGAGGSSDTNAQLDEIINADINDNDKAQPNTDAYTDYQTAENALFGGMNNADIDDMEIAIDANSSTWVWDRITSWLATNQLLSSFLISMLSIGIIKMALGR